MVALHPRIRRFANAVLDRVSRPLGRLARSGAGLSLLDLKLGARMLARSPGLALVGGFGMAVAVALGAGAYAVVNSYFYPELPLEEGDRVVAIGKFDTRRSREHEELLHDFLTWRRELRAVGDVAAFRTVRRNLVTESGQGEPIAIAEMTAAGFRVARVAPIRGRVFLEEEEHPGAPPVVVIGHDAWQSRFGGDSAVIGRTLRIGRATHPIVGVMPAGFAFPVNHQYWIPLRIDPGATVAPGMGPRLDVIGRLGPGATEESAQAELTMVSSRLAQAGPAELAHLESRIVPYTDIFVRGEADGERTIYAVLRFLVALLLVIVAMNVAVLVYARTVARTGEIAVRTALGATRGRIVTQLFAEGLVLSGIAAVVGLGIVAVALGMLDRSLAAAYNGRPPFWIRSGLSAGTIIYALSLAVLAAVIVGVFPALRATGAQLRAAMGSLGSGATARLGPTWTVLIVAQVAIVVAVLPPALFRGSEMVQGALRDPGFATGEYLSTWYAVTSDADATELARPRDPAADSARADSTRRTIGALVAQLAAHPAAAGVTVASTDPWGGSHDRLEVDLAGSSPVKVRIMTVDTSYFRVFDVRMLAGRDFAAGDAALSWPDRPVIVNRSFITDVLGGGEAVGRRVRYPSFGGEPMPWHTIVGVIEDFPSRVRGETNARMYHLAAVGEWDTAILTVRLRGQSPENFAPTLNRITTSIDPMLQLSGMVALDAKYREYAQVAARLALAIALVVGSVLVLSAAGIHALVSFTVNQRRREIGIRAALGAPARRILTAVLSRATRQLAIGVAIGLVAAVAADLLSGGSMMQGTGLLLVPGTAAFMFVIGLAAAAGPARRILRVNPADVLRAE